MAGRVGLDRLAVLLDAVGQPADERRDEGDDAGGEDPFPEHEPQHHCEQPERDEERAPRRPGHVDAGWRAIVDVHHGKRRRRPDVVVVVAHPLGEPVEQGQDEGDHSQDDADPAEHEAEQDEEETDRREDRRERRPRHVDAGRGLGRDPLHPAAGRLRTGQGVEDPEQGGQDRQDDRQRHQEDQPAPVGRDELRGEVEEVGPDLVEHRSLGSGRRGRERRGSLVR